MKYPIIIFVLSIFFSCTKKTEPEVPDPATANALNVLIDGKTYSAPIIFQGLSNSGDAVLSLKASSFDIEVQVQAQSTIHHYGAGNYFLYCCENSVAVKFAGQYFKGIANGSVNGSPSQKGRLTVTNADSKGYSGTFTLEGKNASGQVKSFAGSFKVVY